MNTLLIFFALPIAVIIISIALQRILKCPALVAAIIFAIFLIVTFVVNNLELLIAAIVYALISFITAYITCILGKFLCQIRRECGCSCDDNGRDNAGRFVTISNLSNDNTNGNCNSSCNCNQNEEGCSYQISNTEGLSARVNVIPNICQRTRQRR